MQEFVLDTTAARLFKSVILNVYTSEYQSTGDQRKQYIERITALNNKIIKAKELLLNDDIDPADFRAVKMKAERKITALESKITKLHVNKLSVMEIQN